MRKIQFLILTTIIISCNSGNDSNINYEQDFAMYGLLINQLELKSFSLEEQIEYQTMQVDKESEVYAELKSIDSITNRYTKLIDKISNELMGKLSYENIDVPEQQQNLISAELVNDYFFEGTDLSERGQNFKKETEQYRIEILNYFQNEVYRKNVQSSFSLTDAQDRFGNKTELLSYLYRNTPLIAVVAQLKTMKRNSLEIEQQLLLNKTSCQQRI